MSITSGIGRSISSKNAIWIRRKGLDENEYRIKKVIFAELYDVYVGRRSGMLASTSSATYKYKLDSI